MKPLHLVASVCCLLLAAGFQNCAQVTLERPALAEELSSLGGSISICLDGAYSKDTIEASYVGNLNLINQERGIALDSDGDGLSDDDEARYGFDPFKRRSNGRFLDSICLTLAGSSRCDNVSVTCASEPNKAGLSDCDFAVLGLDVLFGHPAQGIDSDKDGMLDLIEIQRGLFAHQKDDLNDPDHDLVSSFEEIRRGSNPLFYDEPFRSTFAVNYTMTKVKSTTCMGEQWEMKISRLPWAQAKTMTDDLEAKIPQGGVSFTRPAGSNTGLIYLKLRPRPGETGNAKILIRPLILSAKLGTLDGTLSDFVLAGEVEP